MNENKNLIYMIVITWIFFKHTWQNNDQISFFAHSKKIKLTKTIMKMRILINFNNFKKLTQYVK